MVRGGQGGFEVVGVRRLSAVLCLVLVAFSVQPAAAPAAAASQPPERFRCNPLRTESCVLPFPSDTFSVPDAESQTGIRLNVEDDAWPEEFRSYLPASMTPSRIFNGHDGFSPAGPVLFEVDGPLDQATLPADGGSALVAYDLDSGTKVPLHVAVDEQAARFDATSTVLRAWPQSRFEFGHRYVAAVTNALRTSAGTPLKPTGAVAEVLGGSAGPQVESEIAPWLDALATHGYERSSLAAFTKFTVRSEDDAIGPEMRLADEVRKRDHAVSGIRVLPLPGQIAALVVGFVRITDFRDPTDGHMVFDPSAGRDTWVPFLLSLPRQSASGPARVAVYETGITTTKETQFFWAASNAARGIATISIDHPHHGWRALSEGYVQNLASPANIGRLLSIVPQTSLDHLSLSTAVRTSLANLDVLPVGGDGHPDLDTDGLLLEGTSMGGVLGVTYLGLEPQFDAAMLQVPGIGIMHILTGSSIWGVLQLDSVMPPVHPDGADVAAAIAACQFLMDPGEPANFTQRLGLDRRPLTVVYGQGDGLVPNSATDRLVDLTGLTRIGSPSQYRGGPGIFMEQGFPAPWPGPLALIQGLIMHVSFLKPGSTQIQQTWLDALPHQGSV